MNSKLKKILDFQKRNDIELSLFEELTEKAMKYKGIIIFLEEDDVDNYIKEEEEELDSKTMKEHLSGK